MWGKRCDMTVRRQAPFNAEPPTSVFAAAEITATRASRNRNALRTSGIRRVTATTRGLTSKPMRDNAIQSTVGFGQPGAQRSLSRIWAHCSQ